MFLVLKKKFTLLKAILYFVQNFPLNNYIAFQFKREHIQLFSSCFKVSSLSFKNPHLLIKLWILSELMSLLHFIEYFLIFQ